MPLMTVDPAIGLLLVAAVALLFASASAHKLRDLRRFDEIFAAYRVLTPLARWHLPRAIPFMELAVAAALLLDRSRPYAAVAGACLLAIYAAAITVNLRRGRRDLACGCGGPDDRRPIAPWMVWRNVVLALALSAALAPWTARPLNFTDAVTVIFGVLTLALIYLCIDQLMGYLLRSPQLRGSR